MPIGRTSLQRMVGFYRFYLSIAWQLALNIQHQYTFEKSSCHMANHDIFAYARQSCQVCVFCRTLHCTICTWSSIKIVLKTDNFLVEFDDDLQFDVIIDYTIESSRIKDER